MHFAHSMFGPTGVCNKVPRLYLDKTNPTFMHGTNTTWVLFYYRCAMMEVLDVVSTVATTTTVELVFHAWIFPLAHLTSFVTHSYPCLNFAVCLPANSGKRKRLIRHKQTSIRQKSSTIAKMFFIFVVLSCSICYIQYLRKNS